MKKAGHLSGPTPENSSDFSSANTTQIACMPENFNELAQRYIQVRMPLAVDGASSSVDGLDTWGKLLSDVTKYNRFHELGRLFNGDFVSSIDFSNNNELFAVGGQQVKLYNYRSVVECPGATHHPLQHINYSSKIASISFNPFLHNQLVSCCYSGAVTLTDICKGVYIQEWMEHQKKCWSVHYNQIDHKLMASGSDDFTIKLWASNMCHSAGVVNAEANVCAVRFHPTSRYFLAYGCADDNAFTWIFAILLPLYVL